MFVALFMCLWSVWPAVWITLPAPCAENPVFPFKYEMGKKNTVAYKRWGDVRVGLLSVSK